MAQPGEPAFRLGDCVTADVKDIWTDDMSVLLTSFWGWSPETWGTVGWTGDRGLTRRTNLLKQLTDPFVTVGYVTGNKTETDPALKGMVAGFYLVSHQTGDRDEFTHPSSHASEVGKWRHSLRALRAFSYLPEYRISAKELDPFILSRARTISAMGEILRDRSLIERLRKIPHEEVEVFTSVSVAEEIQNSYPMSGMVLGGPASKDGYIVAGDRNSSPVSSMSSILTAMPKPISVDPQMAAKSSK